MSVLLNIRLLFVVLLFSASWTSVWADAEFSDEPVDQITDPSWFKQSFLDLNDDVDDAKSAGKSGLILFFGQPHCAYCQALVTNDFGDDAIAKYTQKNFDVVALDIFGERSVTDFSGSDLSEHDFAMQRKAELTPTLEFYNTEKQLVFRLRGYYPPEKFKSALRYVVEKQYLTQRFRDYLASLADDGHIPLLGNQNSAMFESPPYQLDRSQVMADKPLMVLFEKGQCKTCKQLHDSTLNQDSVKKLIAQFDAVQLDMWSDTPVVTPNGDKQTAVEWAENMGLFFAPTIVFFDSTGSEIYRVDSLVKLNRLAGILRYLLSGDYTDEPNYERWKMK